MNESQVSKGARVGIFQVTLLVFTIGVLAALAADTLWRLPKETSDLIHMADTMACGVFCVDFCIR